MENIRRRFPSVLTDIEHQNAVLVGQGVWYRIGDMRLLVSYKRVFLNNH